MTSDMFIRAMMSLFALVSLVNWFVLSWMFILGFEGLNPVVAVVFWIIFSIFGLSCLNAMMGTGENDEA